MAITAWSAKVCSSVDLPARVNAPHFLARRSPARRSAHPRAASARRAMVAHAAELRRTHPQRRRRRDTRGRSIEIRECAPAPLELATARPVVTVRGPAPDRLAQVAPRRPGRGTSVATVRNTPASSRSTMSHVRVAQPRGAREDRHRTPGRWIVGELADDAQDLRRWRSAARAPPSSR